MGTARALGIRTIAVDSDVDAGVTFVLEADLAVRIGAALAKDSYLRQERIIAAAKATGVKQSIRLRFPVRQRGFREAVVAAGLG